MAENNARPGFHFQIPQAGLLLAGEIKYGLGKFDIGNITAAQLANTAVNFGIAQAVIPAIVFIKFDRQFANGFITALFNIRENKLYRFSYLPLGFLTLLSGSTGFKMVSHNMLLLILK